MHKMSYKILITRTRSAGFGVGFVPYRSAPTDR
jgi:hypothetical protein